ncbi:hypothetical protein [Piscinibacter sp.]|jgi:hypothetical protein|uniref:hypothetical protein n=1 Tax=Piscinibacter sp. TaxID=1903157 RepID=UPI002F3F6A42
MTLRKQILVVMENAFRRFEAGIESPHPVPWRNSFVLRYRTQSIEQALVQKLARVVSGLHAADVLLSQGFVQEQGVLHRTLDEINEDILFLAAARTNDRETPLHKRYLKAFYEDQVPERVDPKVRVKRPPMPTRHEIRQYVGQVLGKGMTLPDTAGAAIHRAYSGYVHAASQNIMDLCHGDPPRFHLQGMLGTPRIREHADDSWNYLYRGFCSVIVVAKAFGDAELLNALAPDLQEFQKMMGAA